MILLACRILFSLHNIRKLILLFMLIPTISNAEAWNLEQLMNDLAQVRSSHATFVEKKSIAMLTAPIESSGELIYNAPDHLEKRTLKPKSELMILDKDSLLIEMGKQQNFPMKNDARYQRYNLQLQDYPEIAVFIDSIRCTLAGDLNALKKSYQLSLIGDKQSWTLSLTPSDEKMLAIVQRIDIAGEKDLIRSIEISQTDGDSSMMLIEQQTTP
jgi:outer membrane lipoprotein-sorting protein